MLARLPRRFALAALLALTTGSSLPAVNYSFGSQINSGFALADGTDLAPGSLVLIGTFDLGPADLAAHADNFALLRSSWTLLLATSIGAGDPAGVGEDDPANAGLFAAALAKIDTTAAGTGFAGRQLYYWVFDAANAAEATQHGIFTSNEWIVPSGDATPFDFGSMYTDLADLTVDGAGLLLDDDAVLVAGGFGPGTNLTGGGADFTLVPLAAIPEPSTSAALLALGVLACGVWRRRRLARS